MNKKRKISLIVLSSVALAFLVTALVLMLCMPNILGAPEMSSEYLDSMFKVYGGSYTYSFDKECEPSLYLFATYLLSEQTALAISVIQLVFTGVVAIAFVLGLVFVCVKKKPAAMLVMFLLLFAGFIGGIIVACGGVFLDSYKTYMELQAPTQALANLLLFIFAVLGVLLAFVVYVLAIIFVAKEAKPAPDYSIITDSKEDPEVVQEGEELTYEAPAVVAVPVVEPEPVEEPAEPEPVEEPAPEPVEEKAVEPEPAPSPVEVNVNNNNSAPAQPGIDQASLASLLREVVRDIVRDEIARNNLNQPQPQPQQPQGSSQNITGATFGGPLVVQYFNGGINGVNPYPAPAPEAKPAEPVKQEVPAPAPVVEEKKPEPEPVPEVKEEPAPAPVVEEVKEEPLPAPAPAPVVEVKPEAPKYERLTFTERLLQSEKDVHELYNEIKNEILSYGVKSRISANGDTFRLHKKMYVRITVAGKSLKLYFALNPADYANTTLPIQDASHKEMYQEIPLVFKVKSGLSLRRCKDLIQDVMEKDGLEQGEIGKVNWIKELKAEAAAAKKKEKEEK